MGNYDSNYAIAQEISARIGNSPIPFDSVYSICLLIYQELGGTEQDFDSVYSILLEILPLVDGGISSKVIDDSSISLSKTWSSSKISTELANAGFDVEIVQSLPATGDSHTIYFMLKQDSSTGDVYDEWMYIDGNWELVGNTQIDLSDYATINYVDEQIETLIGNANSDIEGKETEDFTFVQTLPVEGKEDQLVVIKSDNADSLYKYVSGEWVEQTPDANILYFDVENEALYSYVTAQHQFAPISLVNTIVVGSNLNNNVDLKALKTPGVYSVVQRLHSSTKGDYVKNWTLYVESVDYEEYDKSDSVYQRLVSNYTIQKRTWSSTRATNDGWSSFSTYYAGEIKDSTVSKYYTWSSSKLNTSLGAKQDVLTTGQNIAIDASNAISAEGYVFDSSNGSLATIYRQDEEDGSALVANNASGLGAVAEGYLTVASGNYGAHSEGQVTTASGSSSHAEGIRTSASGSYSHAEGAVFSEGTFGATGDYGSHAEGYETLASGVGGSHAEGYKTIASGNYGAHSEGQDTTASGRSSHAEGYKTIASDLASHAEGTGRVKRGNVYFYGAASGSYSHAEGLGTEAIGAATHAEGASTQALNLAEHAEGICNLSHKVSDGIRDAGNTIHSVGIGYWYASDPTTLYRTNAEEIMGNGDQYIIGVGGYEGTDTKVQNASIMTVQEVINGKADAYEVATNADIEALFTLPSFYVDNTLFETYGNLTWSQWLASRYNTAGFTHIYTAATYNSSVEQIPEVSGSATPTEGGHYYSTCEDTYVPAGPADNEIWYTTESGELWEPFDEYDDGDTLPISGNQLLTNTYENEHGVLRYANNITGLDYGWGRTDYNHPSELTTLTLPHSITMVNDILVGNSNLNTMYYNGTVAECGEIDFSYFGDYADFDINHQIVCLDGIYDLYGESEY